MSEVNVYGSIVASSSVLDTGIDNQQYALFQLKPEFIRSYNGHKMNYWLKDVADIYRFAFVSVNGNVSANSGILTSIGVRPRFLIG